jgi:hypothetical protein
VEKEKRTTSFFILFLLFIIFFALATELPRRQNGGFFSDESGYFSIIQSLAHDFDIKYERKDLQRIKEIFPSGPVGFFLKKGADGRYYYAKSFAYPLMAAPFFRIFSVRGLLLFNGLMIFLSILMAFLLLRQYHPHPNSLGFSLVFILASITPIYIWWMTADLFNFFVMFAGLFFFFYNFKRPWLFYLSGIFFTLSVFSKPWNAAAIGVIFLILLSKRQWKKFILLSLICLVLFSGFVVFLSLQTGEFSYTLFQGGERRTFISGFPYETDEPAEDVFARGINMSFDGYWQRFYLSPRVIVSNLFYYFFGRFTGIFVYFFPACFLLIVFFFQRKVPEDWFVLGAIAAAILTYTLLAPDNYFGGSGAVGNRYFFNIFPLFFFLGFKHRLFKFYLVPAAAALIFLSGVYVDSHYHSTFSRYAGMSFPIRLFPPEKTQYLSLPTNENPRAFGKLLHDGEKTFQVYFLNDNYHTIEKGDYFWTKADKQAEFFLAAPEKVETFRVRLRSEAQHNQVCVQVEHRRKQAILEPKKSYTTQFKKINGLKMKGKYIYHIKIKSDRSWIGYSDDSNSSDKRPLGVMVQIGLDFAEK